MFPTDYAIDAPTLARAVEERGFDSLFFPEHTHIPSSRRTPWPGGAELPREYSHTLDPFVAIGAAAAVTKDLLLGTGICLVIQRDPITLAKEVASVDFLSGGRFLFGIGGGWNVEEMEDHGTAPGRRWKVLRERIEAMKEIWTKEEAEYHGEFVDFPATWSWPKPIQKPYPPILIGAGGKRMLSIAAREADIIGINPNLAAGEVNAEVGKDGTAERADRKLAWIREAAGDRFGDIEFNSLIFIAMVTDDRLGSASMFAPMFGLTPEEALEVPNAFVGSIDDMCEDLEKRRERWQLSYYTLSEGVMESFAPVVERMAGK